MKRRICLAPGPGETPRRIERAMFKDSWHHRIGPYYTKIELKARKMMKRLFDAQNAEILFYSAGGTVMMEAVVKNFVGPRDEVVVISSGFFGERWEEIAKIYQGSVVTIKSDWGRGFDEKKVAKILASIQPKILFCQATDTSTGTLLDLALLSKLIRSHSSKTLLAVDAVLEAGLSKISMRDCGINVLVGSSQKGFMLPPGLGFVLIDPKAEHLLSERSWPAYTWDFKQEIKAARRGYINFTPPTHHIAGLHETLRSILKNEKAWYEAIRKRALHFRKKMGKLGFTLFTKEGPSNGLSVLLVPPYVNYDRMKALMLKGGFIVAGGIFGRDAPKNIRLIRVAHFPGISERSFIRAVRFMEYAVKKSRVRKKPR